ncbi:hypothetical protein [Prosthecobacter sp.]|uniref:hypothetical protein n=1 Tax=Prosthecobacter sp. TaxID=1965333 RepID=UPI002AB814E0|nr:hypothetical protein [Prosthecobacter sp.]MDZ4403100.1 hypothetical protein [Prosthecobacter sp.]
MAVKIYSISSDLNCWALLPTQRQIWKNLKLFQLENMRPDWGDISFYVRDPTCTRKGNFHYLSLGCLAYDRQVAESDLGEIIELSGEVLPATLDGTNERFYVFNPTACYNCFDRRNSIAEWTPDGTVAVQVQKFVFHADRIGDCNLFKIPEMKRVGLFALVGRDDPENEFYAQYHALGFTGLKFEEVWSDEVS